ncbi:hypothetical protein [Streptomyces sp. DH41]|uniref:hypothetical protein n=1 Tax=Streptomyces sp. DH41 TaxID=3040125 RepID=UPI002442491D|nr:hypothetical protein [Streptomyces sp. DH41]MDG9727141.1 hypothetical protein [Streptomyces sp. DH41]
MPAARTRPRARDVGGRQGRAATSPWVSEPPPNPTRRRPRRALVLAAVTALLAVGIPTGISLSTSSTDGGDGRTRAPATGETSAAPDSYTLGVAYAWGDDEEGRVPRIRAQVVEAALEEAERRARRALPVNVVPVQDYGQTPAVKLMEQHPDMIALIGDVDAGFAGAEADWSQEMAVVNTCDAGGDPGYDFALPATEFEVGRQAGRYLAGAYDVDEVVDASESYWDTDTDEDSFGHGLRAAGLTALPLPAQKSTGDMGSIGIARDLDAARPDAVSVADLRAGGEEEIVPVVRKRGTLIAVHANYASACDVTDQHRMFARQEKQLPDGSLRFRAFHDERQKPDCATFPRLCTVSPRLAGLLKYRGTAELYDATLAVAAGIDQVLGDGGRPSSDTARERLRATLETVESDGLLGHYAFEKHQAQGRPVWVDRLEHGEWRQLGTVGRITGAEPKSPPA